MINNHVYWCVMKIKKKRKRVLYKMPLKKNYRNTIKEDFLLFFILNNVNLLKRK